MAMNLDFGPLVVKYAGLQIPIVVNEQGDDCTPLKPISDLFGLNWEGQRVKVTGTSFSKEELGVCVLMYRADRQNRRYTCIKVSRVAFYLLGLSFAHIRAGGNVAGVDYLFQKCTEWADALHDHVELGVAVNMNHIRAREILNEQRWRLVELISLKNETHDQAKLNTLRNEISELAAQLGIPYQPDLLDGK
jgi:hypothetical protein